MSVFEHIDFDGHEGVYYASDAASGLRAIIAVHSTNLGPAGGGTRLWTYEDSGAALTDALRLSKGMSYKNAMAGIPLGGGKGVIMRPEGDFDREALFKAYGRAVDRLGGTYYTAEDVGVSPDDMRAVRTQTRFVAGLDEGEAASGDPSPVTADGVFRCLKVAASRRLGVQSLSGVTVSVQGLGHVGFHLCRHLHDAGAKLIVTDINEASVRRVVESFKAVPVEPEAVYEAKADIFAPCALGGAVNPETIDRLSVSAIVGAANNQLSDPDMGAALKERGILYGPDYVVNGGGIINVAAEISGNYDPEWVDRKVEGLCTTLAEIFDLSEADGRPTNEVADHIAQQRIYGDTGRI